MNMFRFVAAIAFAGFVGGCSSLSINLPGMDMGGLKMTPGPMQVDFGGGQPVDPNGVPVDPNGVPVDPNGVPTEAPAGAMPAGGGMPAGNGNNGNTPGSKPAGKTGNCGSESSGGGASQGGSTIASGASRTGGNIKFPTSVTKPRKPIVLTPKGSRNILTR